MSSISSISLIPSIHDGVRMTYMMQTPLYKQPTFDHIENIFNVVEVYPQPSYIRNGDRFIRHKNDPRAIGNPHTIHKCLEMDFIESSPLCMLPTDNTTPSNDKIVNIWNSQKEVQVMREKSQQLQQLQQLQNVQLPKKRHRNKKNKGK